MNDVFCAMHSTILSWHDFVVVGGALLGREHLPSPVFSYPRCLGEKIPDDVIFGPCSHLDSDGFKPTYHFRRIS
jgi:hypothetical protein